MKKENQKGRRRGKEGRKEEKKERIRGKERNKNRERICSRKVGTRQRNKVLINAEE
jgi:hypothetical protein